MTARTRTGEDLVNRALKEGRLTLGKPGGYAEGLSRMADQAMIRTKKMANVRRIAEIRHQGKPVPDYAG